MLLLAGVFSPRDMAYASYDIPCVPWEQFPSYLAALDNMNSAQIGDARVFVNPSDFCLIIPVGATQCYTPPTSLGYSLA